jgi:EpsI family protein
MQTRPLQWLRSRPVQAVTAVLILQALLFYNVSHGESLPLRQPLANLPKILADWRITDEGFTDDKTNEVLKADETLVRVYASPEERASASLFVAYFQSQRQGQAPHSPKHCMPGAGWSQLGATMMPISIEGRTNPISVNRFVLQKGDSKVVVLYWYQANNRVIADEYQAKMYLVWDAIRYNRTDTALVRVIVPVGADGNEDTAAQKAAHFVQDLFPKLGDYLPA